MTKTTILPMREVFPYGEIAYEANKQAWPPESQYVKWENLSNQAKAGWNIVASGVINAWRENHEQ